MGCHILVQIFWSGWKIAYQHSEWIENSGQRQVNNRERAHSNRDSISVQKQEEDNRNHPRNVGRWHSNQKGPSFLQYQPSRWSHIRQIASQSYPAIKWVMHNNIADEEVGWARGMKFTKCKTQIVVSPKSMGSIVAQIDEAVLMLDNSLSIVKALQYS